MKLKFTAFTVILGLTAAFLGACDTAGTGGADESPVLESPATDVSPGVEESPMMSPGAEESPMMSPSPMTSP